MIKTQEELQKILKELWDFLSDKGLSVNEVFALLEGTKNALGGLKVGGNKNEKNK